MTNSNIDLFGIFQQVTNALNQNQTTLNEADIYNHDHGDHMVDTFQTITGALKEKQGVDPQQALSYAAQILGQQANSGSSKLYAEGLKEAAQQVKGTGLDAQTGMQVLQSLLSGGQSAPKAEPEAEAPAGGGLLGTLLGSLGGNQSQQKAGGLSDGLDMGDLLTAGLAFFQSKKRGENNLNAIVDAVTAASGMGSQPYRQQSTQLVANTFLSALNQQAEK